MKAVILCPRQSNPRLIIESENENEYSALKMLFDNYMDMGQIKFVIGYRRARDTKKQEVEP